MKRVAIIGGGLGGLGLAVRLAARGVGVTLLEHGPRLGGKMNVHESGGFRFDTGPSLITMPFAFQETFAAAGERLEDHVELCKLDPVAEYVYPDGTRFLHSTNLPAWLETVRQLEPRDVDGFLKLLAHGARLYELSSETFLRRGMDQPPDWRTLKALRHMPLRHGWGNYDKAVRAHLKSPHLVQLLNRYPTYVGSSPYRCPATLLVIPYLEFAFGAWFIKGGLYKLVEALSGIARARGAELRVNAGVERILHERGRVSGVQLTDGEVIQADAVAMNGDASHLPAMLGVEDAVELPEPDRSMSGLVLLAGVKRDLPSLHHHTVFFSGDYPREFEQLFGAQGFPDDPTVYVNAPSRSDRSLVPGNGETLFMMANAAARGTWGHADLQRAQDAVFARLEASGFPDVRDELAVLEHFTPARMQHAYRMPGGSIYGAVSHGFKRAFFRPANRQKPRGLYVVGGSGHPGGGTPTVLISSKITSDLMRKHERI